MVVQCPGGGGRGGSGGSSSSRGSSRRSGKGSTLCFSDGCEPIAVLFSIFIVIVMVGIILCIILTYCDQCMSGKPSQVNEDFIRQDFVTHDKDERYPFETGVWSFRYYQYNKWHGPYQVPLTFDRFLGKTTGQGTDDVGSFIFDGIFSPETLRLALTQKYEAGTGDPQQNLGHTSTIQLIWNANNNQFEGTWYVRTHQYSGEGEFELKLEQASVSLLTANNEC
ncbi:unnamed protein product [Rotaria sp. Silwood1]|nr:unnamed protein product [Rotaria sp. Silwood1]CAF3552294.1 unnamed protein product [Rotaria sp. Silwood1]CAF3570555.1 unnamed protein product [Rotaria sp. Silwood1]CAF4635150.1 unnamed protein product [Rotaria sp. Silwood1]CAF5025630.1 unnamed protein product [Rotaria sp. Silwood1]